MAWEEDLFAFLDDLEGQANALYDAERGLEHADRSRAEYREVTLTGRLMASLGSPVTLQVAGVGALSGVLDRVSADWLLLGGPAQDWIVMTAAVGSLEGASTRAVPEVAWSPLVTLSVGSALRRLAESGERCVVHLRDGTSHDGRLQRVGRDFAELLTGAERQLLVAFGQVAAVAQVASTS